ncbi:unnamed protein product [Miscanthus lutarioriparius]|uniref:Uncharacterized protein n=1 Tax=Miscanthus lutarioriparius TaxID=422564 RepID=A0A811MGD6_9POAL|nr:unnamed protein product [Miscanthus lutarioriparius]
MANCSIEKTQHGLAQGDATQASMRRGVGGAVRGCRWPRLQSRPTRLPSPLVWGISCAASWSTPMVESSWRTTPSGSMAHPSGLKAKQRERGKIVILRKNSSIRRRPRPRPAVTERRLCLEDGRGRVSPIREVDAETEPSRPSCSDSDRASDACILAVEVEEKESSGGVLDESSNPKAKAKKKSWKKLLAASAKKLHRGRRSKEAGSSGSSFRSEGDRADDATARGGGNAKTADSSGSRRVSAGQTGVAAEDDAAAKEADSSRGSRRSQGVEADAAAPVEIDASVDDLIEEEEEEEEQAGIRFPALVLVAIVLIGLVDGKLLALEITVLCAAFLSSVQRSPCGGGGGYSQGRRLELSMS